MDTEVKAGAASLQRLSWVENLNTGNEAGSHDWGCYNPDELGLSASFLEGST